ncbi:MAG: type II CRISPR RNA-guided endonuclease Cas9 [Helicobacteraceae bacterium]|nr:type II CRISPR RNA-guided endonuclease Cas9 [Helicobacteraceae bacterium]
MKSYELGLDIGIASVGWCILGEKGILDLGVRAFDKAETDKSGESLNLARRLARLTRRRLHSRAWRLVKLTRLLKKHGAIDDKRFFKTLKPTDSVWRLRVAALDRLLSKEEFTRVIYHICKWRGFYWVSKAASEAKDDKDKGKIKGSLSKNEELMRDNDYRTAAELLLREFPQAQRNKGGEYAKALKRELLAQELQAIFEKQRSFGSDFASVELERAILGDGDQKNGLFWAQKPVLSGDALLKMVGKCLFEQAEFRAPKNSYLAERHMLLTRINNLRISIGGVRRGLDDRERKVAIETAYSYADGKMDYKQLRAALVKAKLLEDFSFVGVTREKEEKEKIKLPAYAALKTALKNRFEAIAGDPNMFDAIAYVLTVYKEDEDRRDQLAKLGLDEEAIEALLSVNFSEFHHLSLKALRRIVPFMESGDRYDEAVIKAGYTSHSDFADKKDKQDRLPPIYTGRDKRGRLIFNEKIDDIPRNPVVLRSINQAKKVLNAIVKKHGSPDRVHIEMARDLSRPQYGYWSDNGKYIKGREDIRREQNERRNAKEKAWEDFKQKCDDFKQISEKFRKKWLLYCEQDGKCAYSLEPLDIERVLSDEKYAEIDHIWPWSRSHDDSYNNQVLAKVKENQNKGNRTPYEYFGGSEWWHTFEAYFKNNKNLNAEKRYHLLCKDFKDRAKEFSKRNLNDTRYICRFFKNYVERFLQLSDQSDADRAVVISGALTAFLRRKWRLEKERGENDRHHALDAAVVAACSQSMVKRLSDYARRKELKLVQDGFVDPDTGEIINAKAREKLDKSFLKPYEHFREELLLRLNEDDPVKLREGLIKLGVPDDIVNSAKPLFVSRAPQRRNGGAAHKETIYGKSDSDGVVTQKIKLTALKLSDLDNLIDPERNKLLYDAIRERLEATGGKAQEAFAMPLRKPSKDPLKAPIVRSVTTTLKLSGIEVRGGIAKNDTMLRLDIFKKGGKFYLIPIYVWHKAADVLPNKAIVIHKDEASWTPIDDSFEFCLSLYPNDLVRVTTKGEPVFGYYSTVDRYSGTIGFHTVDRGNKTSAQDLTVTEEGAFRLSKGQIQAIEKFNVDCLGTIYPADKEPRRGLA